MHREVLAERTHPLARAEALAAAGTASGFTAATGIALAQGPAAWPWAIGAGAVTALAGYVLKYRAVQAGARDRAERALEERAAASSAGGH